MVRAPPSVTRKKAVTCSPSVSRTAACIVAGASDSKRKLRSNCAWQAVSHSRKRFVRCLSSGMALLRHSGSESRKSSLLRVTQNPGPQNREPRNLRNTSSGQASCGGGEGGGGRAGGKASEAYAQRRCGTEAPCGDHPPRGPVAGGSHLGGTGASRADFVDKRKRLDGRARNQTALPEHAEHRVSPLARLCGEKDARQQGRGGGGQGRGSLRWPAQLQVDRRAAATVHAANLPCAIKAPRRTDVERPCAPACRRAWPQRSLRPADRARGRRRAVTRTFLLVVRHGEIDDRRGAPVAAGLALRGLRR